MTVSQRIGILRRNFLLPLTGRSTKRNKHRRHPRRHQFVAQFEQLESRRLLALLFANVQVDDVGNNGIGEANTSKNIAVGPDGTIYAAFVGNQGVRVAKSTNRGQSFQSSVQVDSATSSPGVEIAVGNDGNVYVAWTSGGSAFISRSTNDGATFSTRQLVGSTTQPVHIEIDAPNVYAAGCQGLGR